VLEGLLRRKNKAYVNTDGSVKRCFSISDSQKRRKYFDPKGHKGYERINRINDLMRCFEKLVIVDRGRGCPCLQQMKKEIKSLYPSEGDVYDMIDEWRNYLMHGREYWQYRVPILVNLICLLILDEIEPSLYDAWKADMKRTIEWNSRIRKLTTITSWNLFPPDIDLL
jgi:hypothetical protein